MYLPRTLTSWDRDDLLALVASLQGRVARVERRIEQLTAVNESLRNENAELRRSSNRQAVPFFAGARSPNRKPPGHKPVIGPVSYRKPPSPEEVTGPAVDVMVTMNAFTSCSPRYSGWTVSIPERRPDSRTERRRG